MRFNDSALNQASGLSFSCTARSIDDTLTRHLCSLTVSSAENTGLDKHLALVDFYSSNPRLELESTERRHTAGLAVVTIVPSMPARKISRRISRVADRRSVVTCVLLCDAARGFEAVSIRTYSAWTDRYRLKYVDYLFTGTDGYASN